MHQTVRKSFFISIATGLVFIMPLQVMADSAPEKPPYPNTRLNVEVGLGKYADRFVIIDRAGKFEHYSVVEGKITPRAYGVGDYFALEKEHFNKSGGINGLFVKESSDEYAEMRVRDPRTLDANKYAFVVKKDDPLLDWRFAGDGVNTENVDSNFVKLPFNFDYYIRQGADDPACDTGVGFGTKDCTLDEKIMRYEAKEIEGKNILLVNADELKKMEVSDGSNGKMLSSPEITIPWWQKLWNFIKSLFGF